MKSATGGFFLLRENALVLHQQNLNADMFNRTSIIATFFLFISLASSAQWTRISSSDTSFHLACVYSLNKDTGFVCGQSWSITDYPSIILRTKDGGASWDSTIFINGLWYSTIHFVNDTIGYISGQDGVVLKTEDMGNTWQYAGAACWANSDLSSLYFVGLDTGFYHYHNGSLVRVDSIPSFFPHCYVIPGNFGYNYHPGTGSLRFLDKQNGYVAGGLGKFARSVDGGYNWHALNGDTTLEVLCAWMSDTSHGVIAGVNGKVSVTNNGGFNWSPTVSISQHPILDIAFVNNQKGYAVGGADAYNWLVPNITPKGIIWKTEDGGYTWAVDDSSWDNQITSIFIVNDSLAYAVGYSGLILKNSHLNAQIPEVIKPPFISVYPNPATMEITVLGLQDNLEINIYSSVGEKVYQSSITNNQSSINISTLAKGIYFLKVKAGDKVAVKKVVKM